MSGEKKVFMVECENLVKIYKTKTTEVLALQGLDFTAEYGKLLAVIGNSGSGKSTLLNVIGALDRPDSGLERRRDRDGPRGAMAKRVDHRSGCGPVLPARHK